MCLCDFLLNRFLDIVLLCCWVDLSLIASVLVETVIMSRHVRLFVVLGAIRSNDTQLHELYSSVVSVVVLVIMPPPP